MKNKITWNYGKYMEFCSILHCKQTNILFSCGSTKETEIKEKTYILSINFEANTSFNKD